MCICANRRNAMESSERLILYCLGAQEKPVRTKLELQKILFLSSVSLPDIFGGIYTFQKHKMGPYSEKVDEDVEEIRFSGYLTGPGFDLSPVGEEIYRGIERGVKEPLKSAILSNKEFVLGLSENELLTYIYTLFPEYQRNSEKWDELKSHRLEYAISMFRKGKITASLAAQVAGMNYYDFEDYLRKIGIRWKS